MSISRLQLVIITIVLLSFGYSLGFQSGKYYGIMKEQKKEINKLRKEIRNELR